MIYLLMQCLHTSSLRMFYSGLNVLVKQVEETFVLLLENYYSCGQEVGAGSVELMLILIPIHNIGFGIGKQ